MNIRLSDGVILSHTSMSVPPMLFDVYSNIPQPTVDHIRLQNINVDVSKIIETHHDRGDAEGDAEGVTEGVHASDWYPEVCILLFLQSLVSSVIRTQNSNSTTTLEVLKRRTTRAIMSDIDMVTFITSFVISVQYRRWKM